MTASKRLLTGAALAVLVSAADTYVIVTVITAIMTDVGVSVTQLQQAAPIISGFLLGYVVALPVFGRASDLYGRRRVLLVCLGIFTVGSIVTATATTLATAVIGRTLQGLGGGGLVPATVALVADTWPAERRNTPLGIIAGVQEFGSLIGPLWGAFIVAVASWRTIFWINVPIAVAVLALIGISRPLPRETARRDVAGYLLILMLGATLFLALWAPPALTSGDLTGLLYAPLLPNRAWSAMTTPIAVAPVVLTAAFILRELTLPRTTDSAIDVRSAPAVLGELDWRGSLLLGGFLGCIVAAFASSDPSGTTLQWQSWLLVVIALVLLILFVYAEMGNDRALIRFSEFSDRAAFGSIAASLAIGASLVAALVDIPVMVRTVHPEASQTQAAFVLLRLLAAVPVGAVAGGLLSRRFGYRLVTAFGMVLCGICFIAMTHWDSHVFDVSWLGIAWLRQSDVVLAASGLGFGLSIAPINAAILQSVKPAVHGLAAALVVLARMMGMAVGTSILTTLALHTFYDAVGRIGSPKVLCPSSPGACPAYDRLVESAGVSEVHTIFAAAAVAAFLAALIAALSLRRRNGRAERASIVIAL